VRGAERGPLLFLGRIEQAKGVFLLIDALARAHAAGACWHVVCAGSGDIERARAAARHCALGDAVIDFVGWVDGDAKRALLQRCEALVLPSLIENMPVAVLEAFAYGKAVIASRVGGVPDMLQDRREGYLVAPGSVDELAAVLVEAWQMREGLRAMGRAGRERFAEQFSCARVVAQMEALYSQCLAEAR
jgi:glycosyltransferase involved in cell wall biosynthesis